MLFGDWAFKQTPTKSRNVLQALTSGAKLWARVRAIGGNNDKCPLKQSRHRDRAVSKKAWCELRALLRFFAPCGIGEMPHGHSHNIPERNMV